MKKYIRKLVKLVDEERKAEISVMENEIRRLSAIERENKGRAINNVKGKLIGKELGYKIVQYGRKETINTEILVGDLVLISKGDPLKSDLVGTVTEKGSHFIKLAIEDVPRWALKKNVRLDLYASDITYKRMEDNLNNLSDYGSKALKLVLKKSKPLGLTDDKQISSFRDPLLNESQINSIKKCVNTKDFFLIHGPFGTGKTRTLLELIYQENLLNHKVLATGESNTSVDNILDGLSEYDDGFVYTRLGHPQRVSDKNVKYTLAYKAEQHYMNEQKAEIEELIAKKIKIREEYTKPTPRYRRGFSDDEILENAKKNQASRGINAKQMKSMAQWIEINREIDDHYSHIESIENEIVKDIIKESDVVLATNSSAALDFIKDVVFDVCIIDEASQASIPSVLIPIAKSKRFILAGDHKQLPPTVVSSKSKELEDTLFEKLIEYYPLNSFLLDCQYRMCDSLMKFPNMEFYGDKLFSDDFVSNISLRDLPRVPLRFEDKKKLDSKHDKEVKLLFKGVEKFLDDSEYPLLFLDTSSEDNRFEDYVKDSNSICNPLEASIVSFIVDSYLKWGYSFDDIGVITPYSDQVDLIKRLVDVEVKSVDGFQGREKEIIIISMVRSNDDNVVGFLNDSRRLNVAITRSKRKLIIVGDSGTLESDGNLSDLIEFCRDESYMKNI